MTLKSIIAHQQLNAMAELAETAPPGGFAEVGVYRGGSAEILYQIAQLQNRELYLFDTFTGTPFCTEGLDKHKIDDEFLATGAEAEIRQKLPRAKLFVGIYPYTHPVSGLEPLAFVHCDCDQYESYNAVIRHLWPLVVPGGILLFDDYPYLQGAKKAVEENFEVSSLKKCFSRYYVVKTSET